MVISLFRRKGKSWQGNLFYFPLVKILAEGAGVDMGELKKGRKEEEKKRTLISPMRTQEKKRSKNQENTFGFFSFFLSCANAVSPTTDNYRAKPGF